MTHQIRNRMLASAAILAVPLVLAAQTFLWAPSVLAASGDPDAAKKYETEADELIAKDDYKSGEIELKNAVKASPDDGRLRLKLADLEIQMNDIDGAQIELKAARDHGGDESKIVPTRFCKTFRSVTISRTM